MSLDELRKRAAFQNTIDVWVAACGEKNTDWYDADGYKRFIKHLKDGGINLRKYSLCVSDAESSIEQERKKAQFAEELSHKSDAESATYAVRLSDSCIGMVRKYT